MKIRRIIAILILLTFIIPSGVAYASPFTDIPDNHWAIEYINDLYYSGVVKGYEDGTFRPDNYAEILEFAAMLDRYYFPTGFDRDGENWKEDHVEFLQNEVKILEGITNLTGNLKRIDCLKMIIRCIDGAEELLVNYKYAPRQFPDWETINENDWPYVNFGVANGVINGYADGYFRPNWNVTRVEVAKMLFTIKHNFTIRDEDDPFEEKVPGEVHASLSIDTVDTVTWNYKEFADKEEVRIRVELDASDSTSVLEEEYKYEVYVGNQSDSSTSSSNTYSEYFYVTPDDINPMSNKIVVIGNVTVTDEDGNTDTANATKELDVEVINEPPSAYFTRTDKPYATVPMSVTDHSNDPEDDMAFIEWEIRNQAGDLILISQNDLQDSSNNNFDYTDSYFSDANINENGGTLVFTQSGYYEFVQTVWDIKGSSDSYSETVYVNSEPQPPTADFDMFEFGFPNESLSITDKSTDPNNDIVKWEWTKPVEAAGTLSGTGGMLTFTKEGNYDVSLKVTDYTNLTDSITKQVKIIPPMAVARITVEGTQKRNRKVTVHMRDSLSPRVDPIQKERNIWTITPLDGQDPNSIKIDPDTSNLEEKNIVFKETGRYKVFLKVHNNFSDANPTHPNYEATEIEEIINIEEDLNPVSDFSIAGASPNFFDNPVNTTVDIQQLAYSIDADFIDKYKYTVYRDNDEDGSFSDESVYGTYSAGNTSIVVTFEQGNSGMFKVDLEVTEEFGQPTIDKFVSSSDRRKGVTSKTFNVNWRPDIKFDIPDWAYTDDMLNLTTQIKDEEIDTVHVNWTLKRANESDTSVMDSVNINTRTENVLDNNGGTIRFIDSGYYELIATITDEIGQSYSFSDRIRIYPLPTAVIKDSMAFGGTPFTTKENRKYQLNGNSSYAHDYYGAALHNIDRSKDYWEIIPLDGQDANQVIKVANGSGSLPSDIASSTKYSKSNNLFQEDLLFKLEGRYKVRYQVTNSYGKKSPFAEQIITVAKDTNPIINFETIQTAYRDPDDSNRAEMVAHNITASSGDSDLMDIQRLRYRFDSDNDGSFSDETWSSPLTIDFTQKRASVKVTHVGKYQFEFFVKDKFGQETLSQFVTTADRRESYQYKEVEVDNMPPTVDFTLTPTNKVDVVFTIGQIDKAKIQELSTKINTYIKAYLEANNADFIDTNIQMIETSGMDLQNSFTWHQDVSSSVGSITIENNGTTIQMYGNRRNEGFNKIYTDNNTDPEINKQEMSFSYNLNFGDSFDGAGVLLNTHVVNNKMDGYALFITHGGNATVYHLNDWTNSNDQDIRYSPNATSIGSVYMGTSGTYTLRTTKTKLTVVKNGAEIGSVNLPQHYGWGFGFFSDHYSHNCSQIGQFSLNNISLEITKGKSLDEVLKEPTWREDATKFVINLSDVMLDELNTSSPKYPVVLSRMLNEELYFAELGTSANKAQMENFIADNDGRGTFIYNNNPNMDTALQNLGEWILQTVRNQARPSTKYVLLNEEINYTLFYTDYEGDPQMNVENWRYNHDFDYFENSLGQVNYHNIWLTERKNSFDKVGKFATEYQTKDNPVGTDNRFDNYRKTSNMMNGALNIFVHRKPMATFQARITKNASTFTVSYTDNSYDPDHQSLKAGYYRLDANENIVAANSSTGRYVDKGGIVQRVWEWKEVGEDNWHTGQLTSGYTTKEYLVRLKVRDMDGQNFQGVWSDEEVVLITNAPLPPIAQFTITPTTLPIEDNLQITDSSYDPNGDAIVQWEWKLYKDGNPTPVGTYTAANPQASINSTVKSRGIGDYKLTLQVRDGTGAWGDPKSTSEIFTQTFKVIPVNHSPIANFNPTPNPARIWEIINWNASHSDPDADNGGFNLNWTLERYAVTNLSGISGSPDNIYAYTGAVPFNGSFEGKGLPYGAYRITFSVTDKPPIPPYQPTDPITVFVTKNLYVLPRLTLTPSYEGTAINGNTITLKATTNEHVTSLRVTFLGQTKYLNLVSTSGNMKYWELDFAIPANNAILGNQTAAFRAYCDYGGVGSSYYIDSNVNIYVKPILTIIGDYEGDPITGETITLKAQTSKYANTVTVSFLGHTIVLNNVSTVGETKYWEKDFTIPEDLSDSGNYPATFTATDSYGQTATHVISIYVVTLKLTDFRIEDIVNHDTYSYPLTRVSLPVDYKAGYYITFRINAKGNPVSVKAKIYNDFTLDEEVNLTQVAISGTDTVWEGKYYSDANLPDGTLIKMDLTAYKGATTYNYNLKESWDGIVARVRGTALQDGRINRTN